MDDLQEEYRFDSFAQSQGKYALWGKWPTEQGFIEFSTDMEVSYIM